MTESHYPIDDLVRRADPVPPDEPLDPAYIGRVAARVEEERAIPTPTTRARLSRRPRYALAAAATAAAVAAVAFALAEAVSRDPGSGPSVALGGAAASCLPFTVETLATFPVAFDGRVTDIDGDRVVFEVETWYRGGQGDTVTATAPDLVPHAEALVGGIGFEEGERYLVSADRTEGRIVPAVCGFTLTYSDEAAATFREAFSG